MFFCLWKKDWEKHREPEKPCDNTHLTGAQRVCAGEKGTIPSSPPKATREGSTGTLGGCVVRDANERKRTARAALWQGCQGPVLQPKCCREGTGLSFTIYYKDNINFLWKRLRPSRLRELPDLLVLLLSP